MRILYDNVIKNNSNISVTNENSNFPIENIYHEFLENAFYADTYESDVIITLDQDYDIDCFAYGYHNLESSIDINFKNVFNVSLGIENITPETGENIVYFSPSYEDVRTIEISLTCLSGILYVGCLSFGEYLDPGNFTQGIDGNLNIRGDSFTSPNGQSSGNRYRNLPEYPISILNITNDVKNEIKTYLDYVGNSKPHFIDFYSDAHEYFNVFYGIQTVGKPGFKKRPFSNFKWDINLNYMESR